MLGGVDLNGNAFGITSSSSFDSFPSVNIDGTPMVGSVDINGNSYGMTSDSFSSGSFGSDSFSGGSFGSDSY